MPLTYKSLAKQKNGSETKKFPGDSGVACRAVKSLEDAIACWLKQKEGQSPLSLILLEFPSLFYIPFAIE
jgi:hypothetical protein